jgi:hypothetical protein
MIGLPGVLNEGQPCTYERTALIKMLDDALAQARPQNAVIDVLRAELASPTNTFRVRRRAAALRKTASGTHGQEKSNMTSSSSATAASQFAVSTTSTSDGVTRSRS